MQPTKRNPEGLVLAKPIALRLKPEELIDAARIASEMNLTRSCLARKAYLAGLPLISSPAAAPLPAAAGFSGGEASASPAAFSSGKDTAE